MINLNVKKNAKWQFITLAAFIFGGGVFMSIFDTEFPALNKVCFMGFCLFFALFILNLCTLKIEVDLYGITLYRFGIFKSKYFYHTIDLKFATNQHGIYLYIYKKGSKRSTTIFPVLNNMDTAVAFWEEHGLIQRI